jgi:hypothetical protein
MLTTPHRVRLWVYVQDPTSHLTRIPTKLGSRDRAQVVAMAYRGGLVRVAA